MPDHEASPSELNAQLKLSVQVNSIKMKLKRMSAISAALTEAQVTRIRDELEEAVCELVKRLSAESERSGFQL